MAFAWRTTLALLGFYALGSAMSQEARFSIDEMPIFDTSISLLLSLGLYLSTLDISRVWLKHDLRRIVLAVLFGVSVKSALVAGVSGFLAAGATAIALGLIFAQVDPIATSVSTTSGLLSERGRTLLQSWASFDDPSTALLAVVAITTFGTTGFGGDFYDSIGAVAKWGLLCSLVCAALVFWFRQGRRFSAWQELTLLPSILILSGLFGAFLVSAAIGLIWRPRCLEKYGRNLVGGITALSMTLVGLIAGGGEKWLIGLFVGLAAVAAHALVSIPITRGYPQMDRAVIATGHQSGLTALVLTLAFTSAGIDVASIAAPGILTTLVVHQVLGRIVGRIPIEGSGGGVRRRVRGVMPTAKPARNVASRFQVVPALRAIGVREGRSR